MDRVKRIRYLSHMRVAKVQASLRIRAVSPEPPLLAHTSSKSRGTFRQKARSLAPLNGWACAVKIYHDGMLEDTNSLEGAHMKKRFKLNDHPSYYARFDICSYHSCWETDLMWIVDRQVDKWKSEILCHTLLKAGATIKGVQDVWCQTYDAQQ